MKYFLEPGATPRMRAVTSSPIDVSAAVKQLDEHEELWNQYTYRTTAYRTAHTLVDDIWVRYNDIRNLDLKNAAAFHDEHDSVWYPAYAVLTELRPLIFGLMNIFAGERLGGVLITRIPPGSSVAPHRDRGWHVGYYNRKFAIQLKGGPQQGFHFEGETLIADAGEVYEFNNTYPHWVSNQSDRERVTLIVCLRDGEAPPCHSPPPEPSPELQPPESAPMKTGKTDPPKNPPSPRRKPRKTRSTRTPRISPPPPIRPTQAKKPLH